MPAISAAKQSPLRSIERYTCNLIQYNFDLKMGHEVDRVLSTDTPVSSSQKNFFNKLDCIVYKRVRPDNAHFKK